ncbi:MAG TPA: hypothetical protein VM733_06910 [Thermoanaerobaculia bacterium]|nr:hypothetical protein [Thermoanaerobaculia bacterium]
MKRILPAIGLLLLSAHTASAACVNRFVARSENPRQVITLLTGKLTFQEAQTLADAIRRKQAPGLEWVNQSGKIMGRQLGDLKIVQPMPVGCDGKPSGVILVATFLAPAPPTKKMYVKLDANTTVEFAQQAN